MYMFYNSDHLMLFKRIIIVHYSGLTLTHRPPVSESLAFAMHRWDNDTLLFGGPLNVATWTRGQSSTTTFNPSSKSLMQ